ncbi:pyrroloquinoline quinone-dependent dehydrogenase [Paracidobacterium acidisoli]|uniref:Pyrroloquinoline quinone-dependent dehydrogenase n=1 Tax=Paracidobacterium acidisoli TaxID=2303751 RepID=A0A372IJM7_9BACT|nr:pyrroloquinoline quinone-dependent dehydrogenase [Paracidobacterium acidisoli]MBT9333372.1 pyrroloquinoline quinone-dependent dehydrogenase [Paracidobacterium acidisoli]
MNRILHPAFARIRIAALLAGAALLPLSLHAQQWLSYSGDPGGTRYSPLKQINTKNVGRLEVAWTFHTGDMSDGQTGDWPAHSSFETSPLVVNGRMYITTPFSRVIALDPETGKQIWAFDPKIDPNMTYPLLVNRGAAWWSDGTQHRIFLGTLDGRLISIDPETGKPDPAFGKDGSVDLRLGVAEDFPDKHLGMTSPPVIYKNVVICGSITADAEPKGPRGDVRAFDARTGKLLWVFHTVPREGEFGHDTWQGDGWKDRSAVNAWSNLSVDTERGIVFLPLTSPGYDNYGADRKGADLFSDSLVALNATTGKMIWYYQIIHHDLWDYDLPAQPVLVDVKRNGKIIPAVAQVTKSGFTFVFNRVNGKPLFDVQEKPIPSSDVPGEQASPTEPFPVLPKPFARQSFTADELTNVSQESHDFCAKLLAGAHLDKVYVPISTNPTIFFPGSLGGANWGGASFDPRTRTLFVNSQDLGNFVHMVQSSSGASVSYRSRPMQKRSSKFVDQDGNPCQMPPWGSLTAIDLDTGAFRWQSTLGVVDSLIAKGVPPTGAPNLGGSLVTAGGLVFIGATDDARFRAFDEKTGKEIWTVKLPASAHASPITFTGPKSKKQYVVIAAGGGGKKYSDSLIAWTLP